MSTTLTPVADTADRRPRRPLNFDRLAPVYRWMEWLSFGPFLWRCRCAFLPQMSGARRALVLGDGDGRFTAELLRRNPHIAIEAVDISPAMLATLRRRAAGNASRLRTEARDLRHWTPPLGAAYDLIVTHFFLDCLTTGDVSRLAEQVHARIAPGAQWVLSEFAIPRGPFGRWVARPLVGALYWAFGVLTGLEVRRLPDYRAAMQHAGFSLAREHRRLRGLLTSQLWTPAQPVSPDLNGTAGDT